MPSIHFEQHMTCTQVKLDDVWEIQGPKVPTKCFETTLVVMDSGWILDLSENTNSQPLKSHQETMRAKKKGPHGFTLKNGTVPSDD